MISGTPCTLVTHPSRVIRRTNSTLHRVQLPGWAMLGLLTALLMAAAPTSVLGQSALPERLNVLFLGDDGHHRPAKQVVHILPYMTDRGINLFYTDHLEDLNPATLRRYDAVAIYGNHPRISPEQEVALLNYVADGGGLVPIHCASAMFGNSDAYVNLVGGAFKSHGEATFRTRIDAPDHPAIQNVPNFESWDETYVHMKHNPDKQVLETRVEDGHEEPWTWVRSHGQGRVFYTAWGHDERTWSNDGFHKLLERGLRWAAGDWALTADLSPPALETMEGILPNYPPGVGWGVTGEPITRLQKPLPPEESMRQAVVEPGFRLELFASEPDIVNPIDMAWDEQGRLWIAETIDYPNEFQSDRRGNDRIQILEDTDADGRADTFTIFADSLNIPTSLTLSNGGVIVAQAPDMLFLKDTNGDGRADHEEVLFTGWGTFDTHAGPSNLRYGFDNHIWGTVGYSAFNGVVNGDSIRIPQGIYRFATDGSRLESMALTNNNTWGLGFSEEGLVFGSTANGNPSNFMAIPNRYFAGMMGTYPTDAEDDGTSVDGVPVLQPISDEAAFYPVTSDVRQVDHHGRYTSAAGHEIYTARQFPRAYWNRAAFVSGPTGHLLGRFFLEPNGSDFKATNEWNMLAGRDAWFAPIQARVGPDEALWVIDWYNPVIQHNPTPPDHETGEGNAYETPLRDRQHSRIYRLVYVDAENDVPENAGLSAPRPAVGRASADVEPVAARGSFSLGDATAEDLLRALRDDNMHWRLTAQRLLVEGGRTDLLPHLYRMLNDVRVDELGLNHGALHALWTMHGLGALDGDNPDALAVVVAALHHPASAVRRSALLVLPATDESRDAILDAGLLPDRTAPGEMNYMVESAEMDPADAQVRLAALLALADMPTSDDAGRAVAELALVPENTNDRWIREAASMAGARHARGFLERMLLEDLGEQGTDSTYAAHLSLVIGSAAADYSARGLSGDVALLFTYLEAADPVVTAAFLDGLIGGASKPPDFTADERAAIIGIHQELPADSRERLEELTDQWQLSDLLLKGR